LKIAIEIVDLPIENGGSFHSYVSLPEGINIAHGLSCCFHPSTVAPVEPQVGGQDFWVTTHRWETYGEVRHEWEIIMGYDHELCFPLDHSVNSVLKVS
jgi:hypothetical protein